MRRQVVRVEQKRLIPIEPLAEVEVSVSHGAETTAAWKDHGVAKSGESEEALARETAALYALPADEYTKARNARAKELKQESPELAAALAKLPKPSAPAAAVNRLARDDPSEIRALVQAGKRLREAQEEAVAGKWGADLQEAVREHRAALDRVQREARRLKLSPGVLERVVATVRAASVDPDAQPLLERGLLAAEVEPSGFALDPSLVPATGPTPRPKTAAPAAPPKRKEREAARARLRQAKEELAEAKRAAAAARKELDRAEREAKRADDAVVKAEAAVEQAKAGT